MPKANKEQQKIVVDTSKCYCCWICVMRCGLRFDKCVNPDAAKIRVNPHYDRWPEISFTEDCDSCGICVRHCPSKALSFEENVTDSNKEV